MPDSGTLVPQPSALFAFLRTFGSSRGLPDRTPPPVGNCADFKRRMTTFMEWSA